VEERISALTEKATRELYEKPLAELRESHAKVLEQFRQEVRKVITDEFVRALVTKRVFVRSASHRIEAP